MASFLVPPVWQPLDGNGKPYPNAKLYVYSAGTTDDLTVYQDNALTPGNEHTQPIVADANGVFPQIFMGADVYKFVLTTSADAAILTVDNVASLVAGDGGTLPVTSGGTSSTTAAAARTALGAAAQSDYTTLNTTVGNIDSELSGIGGSLGDLAAKDQLGPTDFGTDTIGLIQRSHTLVDNTTTMVVTDGTEYASIAVTPKRADSSFLVRMTGSVITGSENNTTIQGMFRNGTNPALAKQTTRLKEYGRVVLEAVVSPGTTDAQTFSLRSTYAMQDIVVTIDEYVVGPVS